jgi:hypothetical protein
MGNSDYLSAEDDLKIYIKIRFLNQLRAKVKLSLFLTN